MSEKKCVLDDRDICKECHECDACDLDPAKKCDSCGTCMNDIEDYRSLNIENYLDENAPFGGNIQ